MLSLDGSLGDVYELRMEIKMFLIDKEPNKPRDYRLHDRFEDPAFIISVAYLTDAFGVQNILNKSIQGPGVMDLKAKEKVQ